MWLSYSFCCVWFQEAQHQKSTVNFGQWPHGLLKNSDKTSVEHHEHTRTCCPAQLLAV